MQNHKEERHEKNDLFACVFAVLCALLCGCGSFRDELPVHTPAATMDLLPEISPVLTPDMQDGLVTDRDGVIGDRDPAATPARRRRLPQARKRAAIPLSAQSHNANTQK